MQMMVDTALKALMGSKEGVELMLRMAQVVWVCKMDSKERVEMLVASVAMTLMLGLRQMATVGNKDGTGLKVGMARVAHMGKYHGGCLMIGMHKVGCHLLSCMLLL